MVTIDDSYRNKTPRENYIHSSYVQSPLFSGLLSPLLIKLSTSHTLSPWIATSSNLMPVKLSLTVGLKNKKDILPKTIELEGHVSRGKYDPLWLIFCIILGLIEIHPTLPHDRHDLINICNAFFIRGSLAQGRCGIFNPHHPQSWPPWIKNAGQNFRRKSLYMTGHQEEEKEIPSQSVPFSCKDTSPFLYSSHPIKLLCKWAFISCAETNVLLLVKKGLKWN